MYRYELLPAYSCLVGRARRDVPFLTGQKGDGKSRRAGRAAADGPAPRRGRESVSRFAIRGRRSYPCGAPLRRSAVRDAAPRKARKKNPAKKREESRQAVALFFCSTSKRGAIGRSSQPTTGIDTKGARRAERLAEDMIETASRVHPLRTAMGTALSEREPYILCLWHGARFVPGTEPVDRFFHEETERSRALAPSGNRPTFGKASADIRIVCPNPSPHPGLSPPGKGSNGSDDVLQPAMGMNPWGGWNAESSVLRFSVSSPRRFTDEPLRAIASCATSADATSGMALLVADG